MRVNTIQRHCLICVHGTLSSVLPAGRVVRFCQLHLSMLCVQLPVLLLQTFQLLLQRGGLVSEAAHRKPRPLRNKQGDRHACVIEALIVENCWCDVTDLQFLMLTLQRTLCLRQDRQQRVQVQTEDPVWGDGGNKGTAAAQDSGLKNTTQE